MPATKLKIALIGYGKMGKIIEELAVSRGHSVSLKITSKNLQDFNAVKLSACDVAIEFSTPEVAYSNLKKLATYKVPTVCGTTGWLDHYEEIVDAYKEAGIPLLYASNFSIGMNIFFDLNLKLATLMRPYQNYDVNLIESHHKTKKDAPSGTAVTLANQILDIHPSKNKWELTGNASASKSVLPIQAIREADVKGEHTINYSNDIDQISISHQAFSRSGFAQGAVLGAEFILDKKGIVTMKEVLGL